MPNYKTYVIESNGNHGPQQEFEAANDGDAVTYALSLLDGHTIELWGPNGLIGRFKHPSKAWPR
jgi:hypothetical protein